MGTSDPFQTFVIICKSRTAAALGIWGVLNKKWHPPTGGFDGGSVRRPRDSHPPHLAAHVKQLETQERGIGRSVLGACPIADGLIRLL
jgi:hypothetical protein